MKHRLHLLALAALALPIGSALAESQYGYSTAVAPTVPAQVTAQARVNLTVSVPRLILLYIGDPTAVTSLTWNSTFSVTSAPTTPVAGSNQVATWDGTLPTLGAVTNPAAVPVRAWTNSGGGGDLSYSATPFTGTGGPALSNISVVATGSLPHPTPLTLAAISTAVGHFAPGTLATGTWAYSLTGSAITWPAGHYTSTVTYTATSV